MTGKIDTDKSDIKKLFKDFFFLIPNYQRHYVWQIDNVNKLLTNIYDHSKAQSSIKDEDKEEYFLGSLVLQKKGKTYDVLDGQQRLTTILLTMTVLRDISQDKFKCDQYIKVSKNDFEEIYNDTNRIEFQIRDDVGEFAQKYIYNYEENLDINVKYLKIEQEKDNKNTSKKNMAIALCEIKRFLTELDETELKNFVKTLLNNVVIIYVSTENQEDAFRMFTVLNSSGVPLSGADILKSMNLGAVDSSERTKYAKKWENIEKLFGEEDFDRFLSHIRTLIVRQRARSTLLNEFQNIIYNKTTPKLNMGKDTISYIEEFAQIYSKIILLSPIDENKNPNTLDNKYKNFIEVLNSGFASTDWIPPLLYFYKKYGEDYLYDFLVKLESKALGDVICKEFTTKRIDNLNKIVSFIEESKSVSEVLNNESLFKVDKKTVINTIKNDSVYGRSYDKYLLLKYEYKMQDNSSHISGYTNLSIEHVLPQTPEENSQWCKDFSEEERNFWTHNIANLILINFRKNSALSNSEFDVKKKILKEKIKDKFQGSYEVLNENNWSIATLKERQKRILKELFDYEDESNEDNIKE